MSRANRFCTQDLPCAGPGLTSYRYKGPMGWVMIGATSDADALNEAKRSVSVPVDPANLQVWSGDAYAQCACPALAA